MYVKRLQLFNFRTYINEDFLFNKRFNILLGKNGHGKTNVVEAVEFLSTLKSHRTNSPYNLIRNSIQNTLPYFANGMRLSGNTEFSDIADDDRADDKGTFDDDSHGDCNNLDRADDNRADDTHGVDNNNGNLGTDRTCVFSVRDRGRSDGVGNERNNYTKPVSFLPENQAMIKASVEYDSITHSQSDIANNGSDIDVIIENKRQTKVRFNQGKFLPPKRLLGTVKTVFFHPDDLRIVKGDPEQRRKFLDDLIIQYDGNYQSYLNEYEAVLRQRAKILKSIGLSKRNPNYSRNFDEKTLDIYTEKLIDLGCKITYSRNFLVDKINRKILSKNYAYLAGDNKFALVTYKSKIVETVAGENKDPDGNENKKPDDNENKKSGGGALGEPSPAEANKNLYDSIRKTYTRLLGEYRDAEIARMQNLIGPHRDDLGMYLNGMPLKEFASQGEMWSFVIALKFSSYDLLKSGDEKPIVILDDIFSHLDEDRSENIIDFLKNAGQVFITASNENELPKKDFDYNLIKIVLTEEA